MKSTRPSLDTIGLKYGTDKSSDDHNYLSFYERFFENVRDDKLNVLEVGVFRGASLQTWQEYFPNSKIIGADIDVSATQYRSDRIDISIIDQSNLQDLVDLGIKHGPFDIILEDGSHFWEHQITTLKTLFPFLKEGGYYIVEDLQTNFGNLTEAYRRSATISCVDYLKKLVDYRVSGDQLDISIEEDAFLRTYGKSIGFIAFFRHACLIEKRNAKTTIRRERFITKPISFVANNTEPGLLKLMAHIANTGDIESNEIPFVNISESEHKFIQGFSLIIDHELAKDISYRARLADGTWTEWVHGNTFVGSRGQRKDLTGFSVRLNNGLDKDYSLSLLGIFSDETEITTVQGGQECVPKSGFGPLRAMQLVIKRKSQGQ